MHSPEVERLNETLSSVKAASEATSAKQRRRFCDNNEFDIEDYRTQLDLLIILRDALLSIDEAAVKDAAHLIDSYYSDTYLSLDPLVKFEQGKGIAGFLKELWDAVFGLAELLSFDDPKQDKLVEVILELRKLPPKSFNICQENCLVYTNEPVFFMVQEDRWNGSFPHDFKGESAAVAELQKKCYKWVNHQAFTARCTEAGIDTEPLCKHPSYEIPNGLNEEQDLEKWLLWAERLKAIEEKGDCDPKVIAAVVKARKRLVALQPDVFLGSVAKLMRKRLIAPDPDLFPDSPAKRARKGGSPRAPWGSTSTVWRSTSPSAPSRPPTGLDILTTDGRRSPYPPDGSAAYLAYLDASETDVHVQQIDPKISSTVRPTDVEVTTSSTPPTSILPTSVRTQSEAPSTETIPVESADLPEAHEHTTSSAAPTVTSAPDSTETAAPVKMPTSQTEPHRPCGDRRRRRARRSGAS
ncbi:hypothetical protein DL771_008031 [Monosporascus sp. 5C6A]|nr:hypothetical protein DL771_008031 [Monosporascus sp. 5C6A]